MKSLTQYQKRAYNYNQVAARLLTHGIESILIPHKWGGTHFIAYNLVEDHVMKCHLSNRFRIEKRLEGKELMIAFNIRGEYFFIDHDELVDLSSEFTGYLKSLCWKSDGKYDTKSPAKELLAVLREEYQI